MTYELLVSAARVPSERAAERTLDCLARLTPRPARIALVDWSHGRHPDLRVAGAPNRHGLARRRSAALNDLMEMADEVWSENLAQQKRCDPIGAEDWCCQCKTKAWGIGECARRGAARMLYMQWGDVMTAGAPQRLLDALDACPPATFAWLQVLRGDWRGRVRAPLQFVYRRATVMADAGHRFMPGMMVAVDRVRDAPLLRDRQSWPASGDDALCRELLLTSGAGIFVPARDVAGVPDPVYLLCDPHPLEAVVRAQRAAVAHDGAAGIDAQPALGRTVLGSLCNQSDWSLQDLLRERGLKSRAELVASRRARTG